MAFVSDGRVGISLTKLTPGTTTDGAGAEFGLGHRVTGNDGSEWAYVQAGAAITIGSAVAINENGQAVMLTKALADAGQQIGFAQQAFADNDMGWVAVHSPGNINVRCAAACNPDVALYTTGTAGVLDDTSTSQTLIRGVVRVADAVTAASTAECIAIYPAATATP